MPQPQYLCHYHIINPLHYCPVQHLTPQCPLSFIVIPASSTGTPHTTLGSVPHPPAHHCRTTHICPPASLFVCKQSCWACPHPEPTSDCLQSPPLVWTQCMFWLQILRSSSVSPQATPPPTNPGHCLPPLCLPFFPSLIFLRELIATLSAIPCNTLPTTQHFSIHQLLCYYFNQPAVLQSVYVASSHTAAFLLPSSYSASSNLGHLVLWLQLLGCRQTGETVVTLVADELEKQWLWVVCFGIED